MISFRAASLIVCVLSGAALCSVDAEDDSDKARITGVVVDEAGKPVPDIEVRTLYSALKRVRTDAQGRFSVQLEDCTVVSGLVASDATGARMGLWQDTLEIDSEQHPQFAEARVVLRPSVTIQVRVEDVGHAPVSGAQVGAIHRYHAIAVARTDDSGTAALRVPDNIELTRTFAVKAGAGFDYVENRDAALAWPPPPPPASVTLTLEGVHPFRVKATDSDGKPVAGVSYYPSRIQKEDRVQGFEIFSEALMDFARTTDANGVATFDFLPASVTSITNFRILDGPYSEEKSLFGTARKENAQKGVVVASRIRPLSSLKGKVSLPDGSPAPGFIVTVQGRGYGAGGSTIWARTRKDGTFAVRAAPESIYMVGVDHREWTAHSLRSIVVKEGQDRDDLHLHLIKGTLVRGTVTEPATGKPAPEFPVGAYEQGDSIEFTKLAGSERPHAYREVLWRGTVTDASGRYAIRLGPGKYRIGTSSIETDNQTIEIGDEPERVLDLPAKTAE